MSKSKHTPGPWQIDWNQGMGPRIIGGAARGRVRDIADARFHGSDDPEVHANARLIAASPELLEALESAKAAIQSLPQDGLGVVNEHSADPSLMPWSIRDALLDRIESALTKAREVAP